MHKFCAGKTEAADTSAPAAVLNVRSSDKETGDIA